MSTLTNGDFLKFIQTFSERLQDAKDLLNNLDNRIGDGDHGTNMSRGFAAALAKLQNSDTSDISSSCQIVAMTLLSNVGGASGPLYSTVFMKLMMQWKGLEQVEDAQIAAGIQAALDGIMARGKAQSGDKTMVDVWTPVSQLCQQQEDSLDWEQIVETAKHSALETKDLAARKGRASYLGERSRGTCDPGSISSGIFFESLALAFAKGLEPIPWHTLAS